MFDAARIAGRGDHIQLPTAEGAKCWLLRDIGKRPVVQSTRTFAFTGRIEGPAAISVSKACRYSLFLYGAWSIKLSL